MYHHPKVLRSYKLRKLPWHEKIVLTVNKFVEIEAAFKKFEIYNFIVIEVIIITKKHKNQFHNLFRRQKNCFSHEKRKTVLAMKNMNLTSLSKRKVKLLGKLLKYTSGSHISMSRTFKQMRLLF